MKAIRLEEPRHFEHVEIADPTGPGPGEVLVRTHRMGVCGTDVSGYLGKMPFFNYPLIIGHELGVEVLETGDGVTNVARGDRCSVEPYLNCGTCIACRKGATNCCASLRVIGVMLDGGLCERFVIRADKLHTSESLAFEQLALVETLGIGCHAVQRAGCRDGEDVLVIGAGPIGLATIEFVKLSGARTIVLDVNEQRLQFCKDVMGVDETVLLSDGLSDELRELTNGDMPEAVIDATGNQRSMTNAFTLVAPTGRLVFVGITTEEVQFSHPPFHKLEGTLLCSRNAVAADFRRIIGLIEDGKLDTQPWITHRTPFDRMIDDFETFTRPETGVIKAIVEVT